MQSNQRFVILDDVVQKTDLQENNPNRSRALQSAVNLPSEREKRARLARELAKIDPREERQLAEQGLGGVWAEY